MKKVILSIAILGMVSCASTQGVENRVPAQTGDMGSVALKGEKYSCTINDGVSLIVQDKMHFNGVNNVIIPLTFESDKKIQESAFKLPLTNSYVVAQITYQDTGSDSNKKFWKDYVFVKVKFFKNKNKSGAYEEPYGDLNGMVYRLGDRFGLQSLSKDEKEGFFNIFCEKKK